MEKRLSSDPEVPNDGYPLNSVFAPGDYPEFGSGSAAADRSGLTTPYQSGTREASPQQEGIPDQYGKPLTGITVSETGPQSWQEAQKQFEATALARNPTLTKDQLIQMWVNAKGKSNYEWAESIQK